MLPVLTYIETPDGVTLRPADRLRIGAGLAVEYDANTGNGEPFLELTVEGGVIAGLTGTAPIAVSAGLTPVVSIAAASGSVPGSMSAAHWTKLEGVGAGATLTNIGVTGALALSGPITFPIIGLPAASAIVPGSMSAADYTKLAGMTAGAAVASVSGTAPIVSSGGATPAISVTAASGAARGTMSAAHYTSVNDATDTNAPNAIVKRDGAGDFSATVAALNGLRVAGGGIKVASPIAFTPYPETYAATIDMDCRNGGRQEVTLTGNVAFGAPASFEDGAALQVRITQGGAGSYTASWAIGAGGFVFPDGMSGTLSATTPTHVDYFEFAHAASPSSHWFCTLHVKYALP